MRLVAITQLTPGARLAQPIFGPTGQTLLQAGVALNADYIQMLAQRGTQQIYVQDPDTADIENPDPLSPALRARVTATMGQTFNDLAERTEGLRASYVAVACQEMQASRFADAIKSVAGTGGLQALARDLGDMLDELKGVSVLSGLNSIKSHDSYTFQHSIDVTIMGLVLARTLGWEQWRLRAFGMGCMLHDIGKLFIAPTLLNKNGKLTPDEHQQMRAHPAVGNDAIRAIGPHLGVLVPLIALQHHERQDGTGYPQGLRGTNTLNHNVKGAIHDFASIAAVADVYDAMTSCRPYRAAWTPARTIQMIERDSGTHFNRAAVAILHTAVPAYPVFSGVTVTNGPYVGWRGIVTRVTRADLNRPVIRLLNDSTGRRVDAVEIDLRKQADVRIDAIASDAIAAANAA